MSSRLGEPLLCRQKAQPLAGQGSRVGTTQILALLAVALCVKVCTTGGLLLQPDLGLPRAIALLEDADGQDWALERSERGRVIGGFAVAASRAKNSTDLRKRHINIAISQKKIFRDQIVEAETGRPVQYSPEEQKIVDTNEASEQADEQDALDWFGDADSEVPSRYIYPDGESVQTSTIKLKVNPITDRHVRADGKVTEKSGDLYGIFRPGVFDKGKSDDEPLFDKFGEDFGFTDRPLAIRDVPYDDGSRNETPPVISLPPRPRNRNSTLCSGKECTEWSVGGDQVYDLKTGETIHTDVGPGEGEASEPFTLDRSVDARTGQEAPPCLNGVSGCGFRPPDAVPWGDVIKDEFGAPPEADGALGRAVPPAAGGGVPQPPARERTFFDSDGRQETDAQPRAPEPPIDEPSEQPEAGYTYSRTGDPYSGNVRGSWNKQWDVGSWFAFILIGPVLTTGVSSFVFFTRGPGLSLVVVGIMTLFDVTLYYFT